MSLLADPQSAPRSRVERRIERRQRAELRVAFEIARGQIRKGHSLKMATCHLALGADDVQERLRKRGVHATGNTIREDLGQPVGRLAKPAEGQPKYKCALTYDLTKLASRFGRFGERLLADLVLWALSRSNSALGSSSSPRARGYLRWALENAHEGVRSTVGNRLAWACATKFGLAEPETARVMAEYQAGVGEGKEPYTLREAMATVRSVHRRCT